MSVVPLSHLNLCRARKELSSALQQLDWQAIGGLDHNLAEALNSAADDPLCDKLALMSELEKVLSLYRELIKGCRRQVAKLAAE